MEEIKTPVGSVDSPNMGIVKPVDDLETNHSTMTKKVIAVYLILAVFGIFSGYGVYAYRSSGTARISGQDVRIVKTATEEGVEDASQFKDTATGQVAVNDGKLTDEGTHILVRGDASQNVYLTSSVVDLSKYEGKQVQVWGSTFKGQKAGWLMDVGRVKLK